ncbi:hypothetical protein B0H21DRAFT_781534 [Amylocystis lapponica]|nr:hypothetical protein B0H21DRAFT_781534 [Amylocystis lapponica]
MSLNTLPYDLLLNIAQHLELVDIYSLQLTCHSLYDLSTTRPIYRNLAVALLRRCRALPLQGFQRLSDLTTSQLISAVRKAAHLEHSWLTRTPQPSRASPYVRSLEDGEQPLGRWYKVMSAPPGQEVDWLSPITSSYSLCATKSGKMVCWDVHRDICLAEWDPHERWELWKCRVEFDIRTVFFTMAKVIHRTDDRLMEFVLMKLQFPDPELESDSGAEDGVPKPVFSSLATFKTVGVVMNVFLLDPASRLLSAFVWLSGPNTIGLYAVLDWAKQEYVFIDTGILCSVSSNWSCVFYKKQIVIHSEDSALAHQFFYPLSLLQQHAKPSYDTPAFVPVVSALVEPTVTMSLPFIFPAPRLTNGDSAPATQLPSPNPFPFPPWYPESAHFVRQWWPTLPSVPRLSCTVVLLADHDPESHRTRFVLTQHYFNVPLVDLEDPTTARAITKGASAAAQEKLRPIPGSDASPSSSSSSSSSTSSSLSASAPSSASTPSSSARSEPAAGAHLTMRIWYVSQPFEVVCVIDEDDEDDEDGDGGAERPRPLMAVDFGHAVWIEYDDKDDAEAKRLRFVSFPPVVEQGRGVPASEGAVRTLEIPAELELDAVETINIDQSQGGQIFILCYE